MILREVLITLKYGVKAVTKGTKTVNGQTTTVTVNWVGGSPVIPADSTNVYPGLLGGGSGNPEVYGSGLIEPNAISTDAFKLGGEYDMKDFLMSFQPTFTGVYDNGHVPLGIAFNPVWGLPTDPATPDGSKYLTVLFFPCIVLLSLDIREIELLGSNPLSGLSVGDGVTIKSFSNDPVVYFWDKASDSDKVYGKVLAVNNGAAMIYFNYIK